MYSSTRVPESKWRMPPRPEPFQRRSMHAPLPSSSTLKAVLGPTNTGKTHYAIERMLAHPTGMIGLPLRLLAREVYNRACERVGRGAVALVTGEERIVPARARYWIATVEAMPLDMPVAFVAVDEIQTATDFDRGHVFTDRILHARGTHETLLLGAATMAPVIRALLPRAEIDFRPRFSQLVYAGSRKIGRQARRTAIVAFSASEVYAIAELLRRERGGAAVVLGALSPRTRNAQVDLYQNGDVDFLVATDAIGMGLNLDVQHVAFAADTKFDGHQTRPLTAAELGQIAGRAGRHTMDGTFGVTGGAAPFDEDLIERLEAHEFDPVKVLQWRNRALDFASVDRLKQSLDAPPADRTLTRVPVATDQAALEFLARSGGTRRATDPETVRLLWECCQIPDYRDISPAQHAEIVGKVFNDLSDKGRIDADWIAEQVRFCDNATGDIDTLSNRIRQIRTWTFVANRRNWLEDPNHWRETTRDIEDRLSDALHERLTQRFVDRRTSVLIRHLRDRRMVSPEINDKGEIFVEEHLIGTIEGFRFSLARSDGETDAKGLRAAAANAVAPAILKRAEKVAGAPNEEFILTDTGQIRWRGEIVAELAEGDQIMTPRVVILADESLTGPELERVQDRLSLWVRHTVNTQLEQVATLFDPPEVEGAARGVAFQLAENLGILPRAEVAEAVKGLDQEVRGKLRKLGVKFGAYHIYLPATLKPAPRQLAILLWALKNGGLHQAGVSDLPHVILSGRTSFEIDPAIDPRLYEVAGFRVAGKRAVRVDILERLADLIRPLIAFDAQRASEENPAPTGAADRNGFRVTVEMTSLLGCSGEDFASILKWLGYRVRRTPVEPATADTAPGPATQAEPTPATDAKVSPAAPTETAAADAPAEAAPSDAPPEGPSTEETSTPANADVNEAVECAPAESTAAVAAEDVASPVVQPPAQQTATAEGPVEPQFDEVWFPAGRRPDHKPRHKQNARGNRRQDGAANGREDENADARGAKKRQGKRPNGKQGGRHGDARPGSGNRRGPRQDKPVDPDSPFAALAALKLDRE